MIIESGKQPIEGIDLISKKILDSIPNEPKIPLYNYLLDLTNESDGKENSIYLNNVNNFIKDIWNEIIKRVEREIISKELGIHKNTIYGYKNGKKAISIQMLYKMLLLWKKYCNKKDKDTEDIWNNIFQDEFILSTHSKHQKTKLPKFITPKLSYLMGWMVGDGHLSNHSNHYIIKISEKSTGQLKYILKPLFKDLFNVETPIFQRYMGGYAIQISSKPIYRFLIQIIKIKVGEIPKIVNKMDKINKRYFLVGVFDSEGYVPYDKKRVIISQAKIEFLNEVIKLFKELNIQCNGPTFHKTKLGEWYTIRIESKKEFLKFYNQFGSCHIDKLQRLQNLVNKID